MDHTLTCRSSGRHFALAGFRRGVFPLHTLLMIPFHFLRYRLGMLDDGVVARPLAALAGKTREELDRLAEESFRYLEGDLYREAEALIRRLKAEGSVVAFATSSLELIVRPLARHLGVDHVVASTMEFSGGVCTGRLLDGPLFAERKRDRALELVRRVGREAGECAFYTDSILDRPLLEAVGRPTVVNPDPRLAMLARRRGWPMLRFRS